MKLSRRTFSASFKLKVVLKALKRTVNSAGVIYKVQDSSPTNYDMKE